MERLIHEWKVFKTDEIINRFLKPHNEDTIKAMIMSAIDEGFRASKECKELQKDIQKLQIKLERLSSITSDTHSKD